MSCFAAVHVLNFGPRYGVITKYQNTWFVKLMKDEKSGKSGIWITDRFSTVPETEDKSDNATKNPGGWSRSQALLWFCMVASEDEDRILNDGGWKVMTAKMITLRDKHNAQRDANVQKDLRSAAKKAEAGPKRRSDRLAKKRDEEDDEEEDNEELFPMDHINGVLDVSRSKVVPILGGGGLGFKGQSFKGVPSLCFAKVLNTVLCEEEILEEIHHGEEVYRQLLHLGGRSIPRLVFAGDLEQARFAVITTDEGDNLSSTAGIQLARHLEEQESGAVFQKALKALCSLHESGFAHGDVALRNIVMKPDLSLKLIDLGRAKNLSSEAEETRELIFAQEREDLRKVLLKINCAVVDDTGAVLSQQPKKMKPLQEATAAPRFHT